MAETLSSLQAGSCICASLGLLAYHQTLVFSFRFVSSPVSAEQDL